MKKILFLSSLLLISCKSYIVNGFFEREGIYDETSKIEKIVGVNEISFIKMHHIGTENYYRDVKKKIDSFTNLKHKIYYETILTDNIKSSDTAIQKLIDTIMVFKFRKSFGLTGLSKTGASNYVEFFKEKGINIKKDLVPQPSLNELGLKNIQSENVDATMDELIRAYENKYGEIILEEYDYQTKLFDNYNPKKCKYKINKKEFDEFILDYRNNIVIDKINKNKNSKILIIYGKGHFIGIKEKLEKLGYK